MKDPRLEEALRLLAPASGDRLWHGGASVLGCLRGVPAETAAWRPAGGAHGIWELTLHVAYWKYAVRRVLEDSPKGTFPRTPSNWPRLPDPPDDRAWTEDRALLRSEHQRLAEAIRRFEPERLDEETPGSGSYRFIDLILGIVLHDVHHVGQIQLLKRLYRSSGD